MRRPHVFFLAALLLVAGVTACDAHQPVDRDPASYSVRADASLVLAEESLFPAATVFIRADTVSATDAPASGKDARDTLRRAARTLDLAFARSEFNPCPVQLGLSGHRQDKKNVHHFFERTVNGAEPSLRFLLAVLPLAENHNDTPPRDRGVPGRKPDDPRADPCSPTGERRIAA